MHWSVAMSTRQGIHRHQTPPRYRNAANAVWPNVTSTIKPEVHNISQRRQRRTEPRPWEIRTQNFVKIGPAVPEICSRTDRHTHTQTHRQTDRRVDHNTLHLCHGGVLKIFPDAPSKKLWSINLWRAMWHSYDVIMCINCWRNVTRIIVESGAIFMAHGVDFHIYNSVIFAW